MTIIRTDLNLGTSGGIRTPGFQDLQSRAFDLSATDAYIESMLLHHIETHYTTGLGLLLYPVTA